jgi:hypothetical protein
MTRAEMLARITSAELSEWMALYRIEHEERQAEEESAPKPPERPPS